MNLVTKLIDMVSKKRKRIVVIGDVMVDHWVHGHIEGCQDGCPKFVMESNLSVAGGAGNAGQCLQNWDVDRNVFGQLGTDCPNKWRFVSSDNNKTVFRYDDELKKEALNSTRRYARMSDAVMMVSRADAVLLSDYDKGFLTPEFIRNVIDLCAKRRIPCVVDVKRPPYVYEGAILKGNIDWCQTNKICDVVTRGDQPPFVRGVSHLDQLSPVKCVNHVGAGDCFAAHLTLALAYGFLLKDAATIAHSAGRVYVQHPHNRPPHPHEIEDDLKSAIRASV